MGFEGQLAMRDQSGGPRGLRAGWDVDARFSDAWQPRLRVPGAWGSRYAKLHVAPDVLCRQFLIPPMLHQTAVSYLE